MQKAKTNPLVYIMAAVGLLAVAGVAMTLVSNSRSEASDPESRGYVRISTSLSTGAYTAESHYESPVENWRYVIRNDSTCDHTVFANGGRDSGGNLTAVVYNSDTFTPTEQQKIDYEGQYICFRALLESGDWVGDWTQLASGAVAVSASRTSSFGDVVLLSSERRERFDAVLSKGCADWADLKYISDKSYVIERVLASLFIEHEQLGDAEVRYIVQWLEADVDEYAHDGGGDPDLDARTALATPCEDNA